MSEFPENPPIPESDVSRKPSNSWPIYEKDQIGSDKSLEQGCDAAWGASVITSGEARVELVLEFMREWYRNTDYDWRAFYADIAPRSDLFPNESEMERFIGLPALPSCFDHERFFELLDRWDDLPSTGSPVEQAAAEIASCGLGAEATGNPKRLRVNGATIHSETIDGLPPKLDVLETVCAMQSYRLHRLPEEADGNVRFANLEKHLRRSLTLFNCSSEQ